MESIAEGTAATEASTFVEEEIEDQYQDAIEEEDLEVLHLQRQIEAEEERYKQSIKYYQDRIAVATAHHKETKAYLEEQLVQARISRGEAIDTDYWLENSVSQERVQPPRPTTAEKVLLRYKVKQAFIKNQGRK